MTSGFHVRVAQDIALAKGLVRLAYAKSELRPLLVPLLRQVCGGVEAGRKWDRGLGYGAPYVTVDPKKPPMNRGPGKCYYQTGDDEHRCYEKRKPTPKGTSGFAGPAGTPGSSARKTYNRKYREKVYKIYE